MSPRTGRPKVDKPKEINLTIRIDPETDTKLRHYCDANNIKRGEAVRQAIHHLLAKK